MSIVKAWVSAARLRTLPLSVSGILVGSGYAMFHDAFDSLIFSFAILTTLLFQILSNFANDYGDGIKGTDNDDRLGPKRAFQSGTISKHQFKKGIIITSVLSLISAVSLIIIAFGWDNAFLSITFLLLGIFAIWAAIKYTVGNSAYGYRGLGDLFVFVFFGIVSVCGSFALYSKTLDIIILMAGAGIGLLSTAVLNLNNMRDYNSDKTVGKNTLAVHLGQKASKFYHGFLIVLGLLFILGFFILSDFSKWVYLSTFAFVILSKHLSFVFKNKNPKDLDQELKKVALSTFGLSLVFFIVEILSQ